MKKLFLGIVLSFFLAISAWAMSGPFMQSITGCGSLTCTKDYAVENTANLLSYFKIGISALEEYRGFIYNPDSNESICEIDIYINYLDGTLGANHDYYMRIYSMTGDNLNVSLGQSDKLDGSDIVAATWISANAGRFVFSTPIDLTNGVSYAIVIFLDLDGNPNDTPPESDAINYFRWAYDDENNADAIQGGRHGWNDDFSVVTSDDQDDFGVRIHRMM